MANNDGETFMFGVGAGAGAIGLFIFVVVICTGKLNADLQAKCELACAPRVGVASCGTVAYGDRCICACADEENVRPSGDVKVSRDFKWPGVDGLNNPD